MLVIYYAIVTTIFVLDSVYASFNPVIKNKKQLFSLMIPMYGVVIIIKTSIISAVKYYKTLD